HVAATIDRDSRTVVSLYVDGVLNSSFQTSAELGDLSTTEPLRIAVHATDGFDAFFDGIIDEVTIFNRALSPSEISAIYGAGSAGKCKAFAIFLPLVITPCDARYMDDFSNVGSGWPTGNDGVRQLEYVGGEYRMLVKSADSWVAVRPGIKGTNMRVSVDVRNANGKDGIYGIVFGLADDWSQFYTLQIGADGYYGLWQNDGSWTLLELGFSNAIKTGTTTNHIKIERIGSQINLYANGQMLLTTTNNAYTGLRHVGLITSSFDQENQDVRFDNFDVCSLSGSFATTYQPLLMQSDFP
ncbi:MAG: LamG domain-containing protein, partial [Chloroflexi bacterium]|nr:LamG domain-containing protein [Chloroflexota bacterium]